MVEVKIPLLLEAPLALRKSEEVLTADERRLTQMKRDF